MPVHSGEKPFVCSQCNYSCNQAGRLRIHMRIQSREKPYSYKQGNIFSKSTCSLVQGKSPFIPPIVPLPSHRGANPKEHMSTHSGERRFSCDQCNYSCMQANDIKKHMLQHSIEKPLACNQCSFSCRRPSGLKYHMLSYTDEKPFACKKCKYLFRQSRDLKKHIYEASTPGKWPISDIDLALLWS